MAVDISFPTEIWDGGKMQSKLVAFIDFHLETMRHTITKLTGCLRNPLYTIILYIYYKYTLIWQKCGMYAVWKQKQKFAACQIYPGVLIWKNISSMHWTSIPSKLCPTVQTDWNGHNNWSGLVVHKPRPYCTSTCRGSSLASLPVTLTDLPCPTVTQTTAGPQLFWQPL